MRMTTSWKNKLVGAVAAGAMVAGLFPMWALGLEADTTIKVTGIDSGDTASYYQVIQQNASTKAWELTSAFSTLDLTQTDANKAINDALEEGSKKTTLDFILDGIDAEEAGLIAAKAGTATGTLEEDPAGTYSKDVDPGMYLVLVEPKSDNKDVVYKPIIVSADYDQDDSAGKVSTVALPADLATAVAKKSPITLTKTAQQINDGSDTDAKGVAVGDTVQFTVTSAVPSYTSNFTAPVYKISDVLTGGLKLTGESDITVEVAGYTDLAKDTDYTITGVSDTGYTVEFQESFLKRVTGAPAVTITYKATVESTAATQVNLMDNTVKLNFSNKPSDTSGQGELTDKTRHYTFDIDGSTFGDNGGPGGDTTQNRTEEVQKIGLEANETSEDHVKATEYTGQKALQGATFQLRTAAADASTALKFKNGVLDATGSADVTSDAYGSIVMKGLDEGTYYLVETAAPDGYSFDPTPHTVVIAAQYVKDADDNDILASYTITIDGTNASTYTVELDANGKPKDLTESTTKITVDTNAITTLLINKKLGILPSTGGSGIVFYLVVGGVVAAISAYMRKQTKQMLDEA